MDGRIPTSFFEVTTQGGLGKNPRSTLWVNFLNHDLWGHSMTTWTGRGRWRSKNAKLHPHSHWMTPFMIPNKSPLSCNSQNRVFRPYLKTSLQQVIAAKWAVDVINAQSGSQDLKIGKTTRILGLPTTPIYRVSLRYCHALDRNFRFKGARQKFQLAWSPNSFLTNDS